MTLPPINPPEPGQLYIGYVRLDYARRWSDNCKIHDLEKIVESIQRHGFRNAPIWDQQLNKGTGGIAGGNGSTEALEILFERQPENPPQYIGLDDDGNWYFPVQFGGDSVSQAAAESFAVDLNNLTMAGFTAEEQMRVWDSKKYLAISKRLNQLDQTPVSMNSGDLSRLLALSKSESGGAYATENNGGAYATENAANQARSRSAAAPKEQPAGTRITFYVDDPELIRKAIAKTGEGDSEAIAIICSTYLSLVQ
jgi:hypothetical protein